MQAVVVHPGSDDEAIASAEAQAEIPRERLEDVVLPSQTLTAAERVGIYHGMYPLRMHDALQDDYAALRHFLGDAPFYELVRGYVLAHPSRSYSLNRLAEHLPDYILGAHGIKRPAFCHELARLELAVSQIFDAAETPRLTEDRIADIPPEAWETARLRTITAFRLLSFRYPVNAYLQSVRDDNHDHPRPRLKNEWVAVFRRDYSVWRLDLSRPAHDLLAELAAGARLGDAIGHALKRGGRRAPSQADLFRWFREWVSGGVFQSVDLEQGGAAPRPPEPPARSRE